MTILKKFEIKSALDSSFSKKIAFLSRLIRNLGKAVSYQINAANVLYKTAICSDYGVKKAFQRNVSIKLFILWQAG